MNKNQFDGLDAIRFILFGMILGLFLPQIAKLIGFGVMVQIMIGVMFFLMLCKLYELALGPINPKPPKSGELK